MGTIVEMHVPVKIADTTPLLRLDLGSGENPKEGFDGVDFFAPGAKHRVNLLMFPWPWADDSAEELYSSHFLEHIPMIYVHAVGGCQDENPVPLTPQYRDLLCAFMDEAFRVLKPGGKFTIIVPNARCNRGFQDPTHRRFFVAESFMYFSKLWRDANKLGHYLCACDFAGQIGFTQPNEMGLLHPDAAARRQNESWNVIFDWVVTLTSLKKA